MSSISAPQAAAAGLALTVVALLVACSPQRDSTPLPTKQTTIEPVNKKLEAAAELERKRREEMDAAAKQ